ncbi:MAG: hypothetical protein IT461_17710 [Planctomycetes bacterium]|jgi:hypothetical protein|nr:hypothetical protein [Planctomycetota bacterium]
MTLKDVRNSARQDSAREGGFAGSPPAAHLPDEWTFAQRRGLANVMESNHGPIGAFAPRTEALALDRRIVGDGTTRRSGGGLGETVFMKQNGAPNYHTNARTLLLQEEPGARSEGDQDESSIPNNVPTKDGEKKVEDPKKGDESKVDDPDGAQGAGPIDWKWQDYDGPDSIKGERDKHAKGDLEDPVKDLELMCGKKLRIWLHISWYVFELVGKITSDDVKDAESTIKAHIQANKNDFRLRSPSDPVVSAGIAKFLTERNGWKCESPCTLRAYPQHVAYDVRRKYFIDRKKEDDSWYLMVWVRYRHEIEGVVDVICEKAAK